MKRGRKERIEAYRLDTAHLVVSVFYQSLTSAADGVQHPGLAHDALNEAAGILGAALTQINQQAEKVGEEDGPA